MADGAMYQSSFGGAGVGVSMGTVNPKADGKFYKGSSGAPHVRELLYKAHIEMEENVAMHHPTRNGLTFQVRSFGPGGSIEKKNRVLSPPPKELTKEEARTAKIKKAVLHVLRKEGFGGVRKDLRTLKKLRKEQEESLELLQKSIPRLSNTLRRLA